MRRRTLLRTLPVAPLALAAPGLARAQAGGRNGATLRFVPQSDLAILDPVFSAAYVTRNHALMVFDTLYGLDAQYRPQGQMVQGHVVERDGLEWRLTLREGLRFHDGTPVLARDAVASIRRWGIRDGFGQTLLAATEALDAPDDRTVRFRLKAPFPLLPDALGKAGSNICAIMPERLAQTDAFTQVTEMVGSGPFRFLADERVSGARVAYARFDGYQPREGGEASFTAGPKRAHFERVEWIVMPDAATAAAALQANEADWWENPAVDLVPLLRRDPNLRVEIKDKAGYIGCLRFNHLQPPFNNPALRRAVVGAVNQADVMSAVAGTDPANWRDAVGFFPPGTPMASEAGMAALTAPRDMAAVRAAVQASGYRGERAVLLSPADFPTLKGLADVAGEELTQAGINLDVQSADWGSIVGRLPKRDPVEAGGWSVYGTYWSGVDQLNPAVHSFLRGRGTASANGWPTSSTLETLRDRWLAAPDAGAQRAVAAEIQEAAFREVPYVPLGQMFTATALRRDVVDVLDGFVLFWNARRDA